MKATVKGRLGSLSTILMCSLLEAGVTTIAGMAGSVHHGRGALEDLKKFTCPQIRRALERYRLLGLVDYDPNDETAPIVLTAEGLQRAQRIELRWRFFRKQPQEWDHLWRLVIFDIPERLRLRRVIWRELKELGFYKLQQSVYAHPHDCSDFTERLLNVYRLHHRVLLLTVAGLGPWEQRVRQYFFAKR